MVDKGNVTQTVTATGTLSAVTTVKVGSQVSGIVAALHADFNKQVKKGELLAELDPTPFQAKVEQRQADARRRRRCDVRNAEIALRRQKALWTQELAPQADFDQAQANFDSAVAAVGAGEGRARAGADEPALQQDRRADRRRRRRPRSTTSGRRSRRRSRRRRSSRSPRT